MKLETICVPGDIVYRITGRTKEPIIQMEVQEIRTFRIGSQIVTEIRCLNENDDGKFYCAKEDFGKTVFSTEKEALLALKGKKLPPCPLCGGKAVLKLVEPHTHIFEQAVPDCTGEAYIECTRCGCGIIKDTAQEAIQLWNERKGQQSNGLISCKDRLPEKHDSMFAKLKGTAKWNDTMFKKISDNVNVTVEFENGQRKTMTLTLHTVDGKWKRDSIVKFEW